MFGFPDHFRDSYLPFVASVHICVWLQGRSLSSSSLSPKNTPDLFPVNPGGQVPEGSISVQQLDGKNSCPAPLLEPCRSRRGNKAGPGGGIGVNIHFSRQYVGKKVP